MVWTESDPVQLAKALTKYAKENPAFTFKAGMVEGRVIDVKAILQAEQQVSQGLTEIQRLESQLANQAQMLQHLETDVTGPLTQITGQAQSILQQAQGLGYGGQNIAQQFQQLYPSSMSGASFAQVSGVPRM